MESFTVYGENATLEWQMEDQPLLLFRRSSSGPAETPDRADLLPPEIAKYTRRFAYNSRETHRSFEQGGGHHGSHPHLVHEFVQSIIENRKPRIDAVTAANWTAAGICAHQSALANGAEVEIPSFA
jgi:hypothetical protein